MSSEQHIEPNQPPEEPFLAEGLEIEQALKKSIISTADEAEAQEQWKAYESDYTTIFYALLQKHPVLIADYYNEQTRPHFLEKMKDQVKAIHELRNTTEGLLLAQWTTEGSVNDNYYKQIFEPLFEKTFYNYIELNIGDVPNYQNKVELFAGFIRKQMEESLATERAAEEYQIKMRNMN